MIADHTLDLVDLRIQQGDDRIDRRMDANVRGLQTVAFLLTQVLETVQPPHQCL